MRIDSRDQEETRRRLEQAGIEVNENALAFDMQYVVENGANLDDAMRIARKVEAERVYHSQQDVD